MIDTYHAKELSPIKGLMRVKSVAKCMFFTSLYFCDGSDAQEYGLRMKDIYSKKHLSATNGKMLFMLS